MAQSIAIAIALEGGAEIERQLADIGEAGKKAFADIGNAAQQVGGFKNLNPEDVTKRLQDMGVTGAAAINKIQAAVQSAGRLERIATGVTTVQNAFSVLGAAGAAAFAGLDAAGAKLATGLDKALSPLANLLSRRLAFGAIAAALGGAEVALIKFANAAEQTEKALDQLQKVSGQSISNLSALAIAFEQGGTPVKTVATEFANLTEKIAAAGQQVEIEKFGKDNEWVKWANDLRNVTQQFDNLAAGGRETFSQFTLLDTKVQALLRSLAKAQTPQEQWLKLADIFHNLGSELDKAQLGKALGLSPETIATLSQGSAALKAMTAQVQALGLSLSALDQQNLQNLIRSQNEAGALFDALKTKMGALIAPAITSFWQGFTEELSKLVPIFEQIASSVGQIDFRAVGAAAADFLATLAKIAAGWAQILAGNVSFSDLLTQALEQAGSVLAGVALSLGQSIGQGIIDGIISAIQSAAGSIWNAITSIVGGAGGGGSSGGDESGLPFASGGLVGGRGSGTSDSNLAWVSRGEHIMPARAVRQPGVLALLEGLRRSGGNLNGLLDGMGRFARGGLVLPSFADGGLVPATASAARRALTLNIEGRAFAGLSIPESTAQSLERFAVHSQIASTGRKPSWRR